jgi:hypothetical protein
VKKLVELLWRQAFEFLLKRSVVVPVVRIHPAGSLLPAVLLHELADLRNQAISSATHSSILSTSPRVGSRPPPCKAGATGLWSLDDVGAICAESRQNVVAVDHLAGQDQSPDPPVELQLDVSMLVIGLFEDGLD